MPGLGILFFLGNALIIDNELPKEGRPANIQGGISVKIFPE
jgi:hypothetical protein